MNPVTKSREELLLALRWSKPREVATKRGPRIATSARPSPEVIELFRGDAEQMQKLGYALGEYQGKPQITFWQELPKEELENRQETRELSRAVDANIEIPVPERLALLGYQKAGVMFAINRPASLIADEPGLGKTVQAIGVLNLMPEARRIIVVCPASLKINWAREIRKWSVVSRAIFIADANVFPDQDGVVVINYDVLFRHRKKMLSIDWDLAVLDEAHAFKNPTARRTKMAFGSRATKTEKKMGMADVPGILARRRILLTGTPIANRPIDLFPLIEYLDPERWAGGYFQFGIRYCKGYRGRFGWDFTGSSNLDELQDLLRRTIMIRRKKIDVLTELPVKRRQLIEFESSLKILTVAETQALEQLKLLEDKVEQAEGRFAYEEAIEAMSRGCKIGFSEMSEERLRVAQEKIPQVIEHLTQAIEDSQKVVCFVWHYEVAEAIMAEFKGRAVRVMGEDDLIQRQAAVDRFQSDPSCQLFVGSIKAAGVGLTLTASSHVVMVEQSWVPGENTQCEDRTHRIGQKKSVLVQYLVLERSVDATVMKRFIEKQDKIDQALDIVKGETP